MGIPENEPHILLRPPRDNEGHAIHGLIRRSPPLDSNSVYCYYLLSRHFANTCVVAEVDDDIIGFLSAYLVPERPHVLFVWQVAVAAEWRGQAIAGRMLTELMARPACEGVHWLETTVGPANQASRQLFHAYAKRQGTSIEERLFLPASAFGEGEHESEMLLHIPLKGKPV